MAEDSVVPSDGTGHLVLRYSIPELDNLKSLLNHHVRSASRVETPKKHIKQREDGYSYPEYPYMLEQMDRHHPLRSEEVKLDIRADVFIIVATATVTDLITREIRTGVDAHRITFRKDAPKNHDSIIDLGNDCKSAATEALRNAYSRFGIAADVYRKILTEGPTEVQQSRWTKIKDHFNSIPSTPKTMKWWEKVEKDWSTQTAKSADEFLSKLADIVKYKEETNEEKTDDSDNSETVRPSSSHNSPG